MHQTGTLVRVLSVIPCTSPCQMRRQGKLSLRSPGIPAATHGYLMSEIQELVAENVVIGGSNITSHRCPISDRVISASWVEVGYVA